MNQSSLPPEWEDAMIKAGVTDQRRRNPSPSRRQLAERITEVLEREVPVNTSTVTAMIFGTRKTEPEIIDATARVLGTDKVYEWVDRPRRNKTAFEVPKQVHTLTPRQQAALRELILAMAAERDEQDQDGLSRDAVEVELHKQLADDEALPEILKGHVSAKHVRELALGAALTNDPEVRARYGLDEAVRFVTARITPDASRSPIELWLALRTTTDETDRQRLTAELARRGLPADPQDAVDALEGALADPKSMDLAAYPGTPAGAIPDRAGEASQDPGSDEPA